MSGEHSHPEINELAGAVSELVTALSDLVVEVSSAFSNLGDQISDLDDRILALENAEPPDPNAWVPAYPGQPEPGKMWWSAILQDQKASALASKHPGANVHRTYWQWAETGQGGPDKAGPNMDQAIAAGMMPFISFKTPAWGQVASGQHDTQLNKILNLIKSKQVPIWLIFYHEPEDNLEVGTAADFVAMQRHIRQRMTALGVDNAALGLCLMGFTWDPFAKYPDNGQPRNPDDWYAPGIFDFLAVDPYSKWCEDPYMKSQEDWAKAKGIDFVVGEWGYVQGEHGATHSWTGADVHDFYERGIANGTKGIFVYDSNGNGYTYVMPPDQDAAFKALLLDSRTA
jgi:hypothetical protein